MSTCADFMFTMCGCDWFYLDATAELLCVILAAPFWQIVGHTPDTFDFALHDAGPTHFLGDKPINTRILLAPW